MFDLETDVGHLMGTSFTKTHPAFDAVAFVTDIIIAFVMGGLLLQRRSGFAK